MTSLAPTVSTLVHRPLLLALAAAGVDPARLATACGLDASLLDDLDARLPLDRSDCLWESAARLTLDPAFGLRVAAQIDVAALGVVGQVLRASPTMRDAFARLARYNRLLHDMARIAIDEPGDGTATLSHSFATDPAGATPQAAIFVMASYLLGTRALCGFDWWPLSAGLRQHRPADAGPFRTCFGVEPAWDQDRNWLRFDAAVLDLPIPGADASLAAVLDRYAADLLERLPKPDDLAERSRRALAALMQDGDPGLEALAKRLDLTARTLQRRLREQGSSHRRLLDDLRRDLTARHLAARDLTIEQIAFLLGYQEVSAFQRACKRWTGRSPAELRRAALRPS